MGLIWFKNNYEWCKRRANLWSNVPVSVSYLLQSLLRLTPLQVVQLAWLSIHNFFPSQLYPQSLTSKYPLPLPRYSILLILLVKGPLRGRLVYPIGHLSLPTTYPHHYIPTLLIKNLWKERDDESWWTIQFLHIDS